MTPEFKRIPVLLSDLQVSDSEESDKDDFIVDEKDQPIKKGLKRKRAVNPSLEATREVFGDDFDYDQLNQGNQKDDDKEKSTRKPQRKSTIKSIFEIYEPSDFKRALLTDEDQEICVKDIPERMQLRSKPMIHIEDKKSKELVEEAKWIYEKAFNKNVLWNKSEFANKNRKTVKKVRNALKLMRCDLMEVPFIANFFLKVCDKFF